MGETARNAMYGFGLQLQEFESSSTQEYGGERLTDAQATAVIGALKEILNRLSQAKTSASG